MSYSDPEKRKAYFKRWQEKHWDDRKAERNRREHERVKWFKAFKESLSCKYCGESEACCLDFHHRNPSEKEKIGLADLARHYSIRRALQEIEKCDVVCANCHRKLHAGVKVLGC